MENGCPNVLGRYHIAVRFIPDGKEHTIACVFESGSSNERSPESGERLECQGFYNDQRYKMSIGVECDLIPGEYDYDAVCHDINELYEISKVFDDMKTVGKMKAIVPEYKSNNSIYSKLD